MLNILIYLFIALAVLTWASLFEKGSKEESIRFVLGEICDLIRSFCRLFSKLISLLLLDLLKSPTKSLKPDPFISSFRASKSNLPGVITETEYYLYVEKLYIQSQDL